MSLPYNPKLKERARELRKAGNLAEVLFWKQVRNKQFLGLDFDRQKIIGNYIVDFYNANYQLVIEIDGSSHDDKEEYDAKRQAYLEGLGLTVVRFTDVEVKKQIDAVMRYLEDYVEKLEMKNLEQNEGMLEKEKNHPERSETVGKEGKNHPAFQAPLQRRGIIGYKSSGGAMVYNEELEKEIPAGWEVIELGECLETKGYIRGPFGSALRKSEMTTKGTPVYEQQHVIDNHRKFRYYIDEVKYNKLKRFTVQTNDLIISCSGTVGKINIINKEDPIGIINQALLILRFNRNKVNIHSLYFFLTSKEGNSLLTETSTGSAQINIGKKDTIYSIKILIPSKAEYNKIGDNFKKLYDKKYSKKKINKKLIQFQEVLLSRMVKY